MKCQRGDGMRVILTLLLKTKKYFTNQKLNEEKKGDGEYSQGEQRQKLKSR